MGFRSVLRLPAGAEPRLTGDNCPGTVNGYGVLQWDGSFFCLTQLKGKKVLPLKLK